MQSRAFLLPVSVQFGEHTHSVEVTVLATISVERGQRKVEVVQAAFMGQAITRLFSQEQLEAMGEHLNGKHG